MKSKKNWPETKERFTQWWEGRLEKRPLMRIVARKGKPDSELEPVARCDSLEELYIGAKHKSAVYRNYLRTHEFMAEAFPSLSLNLGPGSLATYLGSEPVFTQLTVWYKECIHDIKEHGDLKYDPDNIWWKKHFSELEEAVRLAEGDYPVDIPDIIENIDILSAMRGPQNLLFDIMDEPDAVKSYINQIDSLYFEYYDRIYDLVKGSDDSVSYTAFAIWSPGKTAKVQCDFSAMISPDQFREFVVPNLKKQCDILDYSLYHLDGPDAIKHLDALMEIDSLTALQWTPGAGASIEPMWDIYDKVHKAGKCIWTGIVGNKFSDWVEYTKKYINRYGMERLYILYPEMTEDQADEFLRIKW